MCWREVVYRSGYFNSEPYRGCAFASSVVPEGSLESTVWKHLLCCVVDPPFFRVGESTCQESKQGSFSGFPLGEKWHDQHVFSVPAKPFWLFTTWLPAENQSPRLPPVAFFFQLSYFTYAHLRRREKESECFAFPTFIVLVDAWKIE